MSDLPDGFTKLEYIQSDGTQYINTKFNPSSNTRIKAVLRSSNKDGNDVWFFGCQISWGYLGYALSTYTAEFGSSTTISGINLYDNQWHEIDFHNGILNVDGNSIWQGSGTFQTSIPLFVFGINSNGVFSGLKGEIQRFQIYENDVLMFDFVPCKNQSQKIGMYDLVNLKFCGNDGTNEFIAGPELLPPSDFYQRTSVALKWLQADCQGYRLYKNGTLLVTTTQTEYTDFDVADGQDITYSVTAYIGDLESDATNITVQVREGYTILIPIVKNAFFQ